jgi:enoyl-CoA hydratase
MIHREDQGGTTVLRLEHGKVQALDLELLEQIRAVFGEVERSPARAVVLTGTGGSFSAGVDLFRILDGGRAYIERFLPALDEALLALLRFPRPIVAAINGHAIAGGCVVACACDRRVMANGKGRVGVPELAVGVPFPTLPFEILRASTPPQHLRELMFGAGTYTVADALARGLIDEVVEPDVLIERALAIAAQLGSIPAASFELGKREMNAPVLEMFARSREHERQVVETWCRPEILATIRAYLERTVGKSR